MTIEFNTREYEFSHGSKPCGRGSWAFFFDRKCEGEAFWTPGATSYADAKKMARKEAKKRGVDEVFVGS